MFARNLRLIHSACLKNSALLRLRIIESRNVLQQSQRLRSDEVEKSKEAAKSKRNESTIFDKIINKELPVNLIYEDNDCLAFNDIAPQAPIHFLVIPKRRIDMVENAQEGDKPVSCLR